MFDFGGICGGPQGLIAFTNAAAAPATISANPSALGFDGGVFPVINGMVY